MQKASSFKKNDNRQMYLQKIKLEIFISFIERKYTWDYMKLYLTESKMVSFLTCFPIYTLKVRNSYGVFNPIRASLPSELSFRTGKI